MDSPSTDAIPFYSIEVLLIALDDLRLDELKFVCKFSIYLKFPLNSPKKRKNWNKLWKKNSLERILTPLLCEAEMIEHERRSLNLYKSKRSHKELWRVPNEEDQQNIDKWLIRCRRNVHYECSKRKITNRMLERVWVSVADLFGRSHCILI